MESLSTFVQRLEVEADALENLEAQKAQLEVCIIRARDARRTLERVSAAIARKSLEKPDKTSVEQVKKYLDTDRAAQVLELLRTAPIRSSAIGKALDIPPNRLHPVLMRLLERGLIARSQAVGAQGFTYWLVDEVAATPAVDEVAATPAVDLEVQPEPIALEVLDIPEPLPTPTPEPTPAPAKVAAQEEDGLTPAERKRLDKITVTLSRGQRKTRAQLASEVGIGEYTLKSLLNWAVTAKVLEQSGSFYTLVRGAVEA